MITSTTGFFTEIRSFPFVLAETFHTIIDSILLYSGRFYKRKASKQQPAGLRLLKQFLAPHRIPGAEKTSAQSAEEA
jgi:hypothetical protein